MLVFVTTVLRSLIRLGLYVTVHCIDLARDSPCLQIAAKIDAALSVINRVYLLKLSFCSCNKWIQEKCRPVWLLLVTTVGHCRGGSLAIDYPSECGKLPGGLEMEKLQLQRVNARPVFSPVKVGLGGGGEKFPLER